MSLQSKQSLYKKLANEKYRDAFVASRIAQTLSFQLRVLRQRAGLSQDGLATGLGTSQNAISRMENPKYGKASISTLLKIASFFKVGLIVRFAPLSEISDWTTNLSDKALDISDYEHDLGFQEAQAPIGSALKVHKETQPAISILPGTAAETALSEQGIEIFLMHDGNRTFNAALEGMMAPTGGNNSTGTVTPRMPPPSQRDSVTAGAIWRS